MSLEVTIEGNQVFAPLKNSWLRLTPEEHVRQRLICKLVNFYGYKLEQMDQDVPIRRRYKADVAIWRSSKDKQKNKIPSIIIAVEIRGDNTTIKEEDYLIGYNVASIINANFFIASNLKEEKIFYVVKDPYPRKLEKLKDIPNADILKDDEKIDKYINGIKTFTREDFTRLLTRCHNIIRNNDKLSPEAAFDEISKILFMKIRYERNPDESNIFSLEVFKKQESHYERNEKKINVQLHGNKADIPYMDYWFELTKAEFARDEIFESNDRIRIKQGSFEAIVKELEAYNLSDTSDDVKGIAFEEFLGKTFRGELGQFFTPRSIVDYMIEILDPREGETVCDPCCGSGGFLIKAFEYIRSQIEQDLKDEKERFKNEYLNLPESEQLAEEETYNAILNNLNSELDLKNKKSRLKRLSHDNIFGVDANPRMARTAKMNMIMHGDGHGGVYHHDGLLNVNGIYEEKFDVILTNPPFGARVEKSLRVTNSDIPAQSKVDEMAKRYPEYLEKVYNPMRRWASYNEGEGKPILDLFDLGKMSSLTEVLFIERSLKLLRPGGRMGIVLPDGVLNNPMLQRVRDYIEGKAKIVNITSIPQDVFNASGATVKPSLIFLRKFTNEETAEYEVLHEQAKQTVNKRYEQLIYEINVGNGSAKENGNKKALARSKAEQLKALEAKIYEEIKREVKRKFDYKIPIIEVMKAGISSTGTKIENELIPVAKEFNKYKMESNLWTETDLNIRYIVGKNGSILRSIGDSSPSIFYED